LTFLINYYWEALNVFFLVICLPRRLLLLTCETLIHPELAVFLGPELVNL